MKVALYTLVLLASSIHFAWANQFDGWSLEQIKADPRFVALPAMSRSEWWGAQREAADPKSAIVNDWIGFIATGDERVFFNQHGYGRTVVDSKFLVFDDDYMPAWALDAVSYLVDQGILTGPCG